MKKQEQLNMINHLKSELNRLYYDIDIQKLNVRNCKCRISQVIENLEDFEKNIKGKNVIEWYDGKLSMITEKFDENIK